MSTHTRTHNHHSAEKVNNHAGKRRGGANTFSRPFDWTQFAWVQDKSRSFFLLKFFFIYKIKISKPFFFFLGVHSMSTLTEAPAISGNYPVSQSCTRVWNVDKEWCGRQKTSRSTLLMKERLEENATITQITTLYSRDEQKSINVLSRDSCKQGYRRSY